MMQPAVKHLLCIACPHPLVHVANGAAYYRASSPVCCLHVAAQAHHGACYPIGAVHSCKLVFFCSWTGLHACDVWLGVHLGLGSGRPC